MLVFTPLSHIVGTKGIHIGNMLSPCVVKKTIQTLLPFRELLVFCTAAIIQLRSHPSHSCGNIFRVALLDLLRGEIHEADQRPPQLCATIVMWRVERAWITAEICFSCPD